MFLFTKEDFHVRSAKSTGTNSKNESSAKHPFSAHVLGHLIWTQNPLKKAAQPSDAFPDASVYNSSLSLDNQNFPDR